MRCLFDLDEVRHYDTWNIVRSLPIVLSRSVHTAYQLLCTWAMGGEGNEVVHSMKN